MERREFWKLLAAAVTGHRAWAAPALTGGRTYTYKVAGACEIKADVHGAAESGARRPGIFWIHGGALIMGGRGLNTGPGRYPVLTDLYLKAGYTIVSIDYRLAPETKLAGIIEDVQDAWRWVREKGPSLFRIDPERIGVSGGSAGGYLTLMTGFCVKPRPRALVSLYGYGDIVGPWYSQPDPFYSRQPPVSKEEAYRAVGGPPISEVSGPNNRSRFYLYCRQQGLWPKEVGGFDPEREPRAFDRYCPIRNVSSSYPPTLLLHGDQDTDVPYEQSVIMSKELARQRVAQELITIPNGGHGFGGAEPAVVGRAYERALDWMERYVRGRE